MPLELLLLCSLIFIFIVSFCGLLQKIKQSYERERTIAAQFYAERIAQRHISRTSDACINTTFIEDFDNTGIFPGAPPPYSHTEDPPKYDDVIKEQCIVVPSAPINIELERTYLSPPPPYTISN